MGAASSIAAAFIILWGCFITVNGLSSLRAGPAVADHDILLRVARGETCNRTPVWLLRQAGRYMADFRKFSDIYPFRLRSETPDIAVELSLQPWRSFGMDAVIMFSDILTPLPAMGIDFDVVTGKGPVIANPIRSKAAVDNLRPFGGKCGEVIGDRLWFVGETLRELRRQTEGRTTLLGFVGSPWTLAAYAMEGSSLSRHCLHTKGMMFSEPELFHRVMDRLSINIAEYACYQVENGAQIVQFFESWAHQLTPLQFQRFAKPYANKAMSILKARHPDVPIVYYANGGSGYLEILGDMPCDMHGVDQFVDMADARNRLGGASASVCGNVDPVVLMGGKAAIKDAVEECLVKVGNQGHVLNLGQGVLQQTPEYAVAYFVDTAKSFSSTTAVMN